LLLLPFGPRLPKAFKTSISENQPLTEWEKWIQDGNEEKLSQFLKRGGLAEKRNAQGHTPLIVAIRYACLPCLESLLFFGAHPDTRASNGWSPLLYAIYEQNLSAIALLLEHGANPNLTSDQGISPLLLCVRLNQRQAAKLILPYGVDFDLADERGISPRQALIGHVAFTQWLNDPDITPHLPKDLLDEIPEIQNPNTPAPQLDVKSLIEDMHHQVNALRKQVHLLPLSYDPDLATLAQGYADTLRHTRHFHHKDLQGRTPSDRAALRGIPLIRQIGNQTVSGIGENLFRGPLFASRSKTLVRGFYWISYQWKDPQQLAQEVITSWEASPGHRANLLQEVYQKQGFGIALDQDHTLWVVQNFW
jgi:ankyrin repeat protein